LVKKLKGQKGMGAITKNFIQIISDLKTTPHTSIEKSTDRKSAN